MGGEAKPARSSTCLKSVLRPVVVSPRGVDAIS
jgi:hypothetical protein